jgi:hypothetical protein
LFYGPRTIGPGFCISCKVSPPPQENVAIFGIWLLNRLVTSQHWQIIMISNERSSFFRRPNPNYSQPSPSWPQYQQKPPVREDALKTGTVAIERKTFHFKLSENPRGRLLRITEETGERRNSIIIPSTGLAEFKKMLDEMVQAAESTPPPANPNPLA